MGIKQILALLCQGYVSGESAKMCRAKGSRAELKHFEKRMMNVNGLSYRLHITCVHLRRWGIDAGHAKPQSTIKETKYYLK